MHLLVSSRFYCYQGTVSGVKSVSGSFSDRFLGFCYVKRQDTLGVEGGCKGK